MCALRNSTDMSLEHQLPVLMKKTQMSGEGAQCGLTSLLPMSCRGRAEAFARRLHTRLRNLGSGSVDAGEHRWLGAGPPPRADSELFFDFELECESPSSPVEELDAPFRDRSPSDDVAFYDIDQQPPTRADKPASPHTSPPRANGFTVSTAFFADRSPIKTQPAPRENGHADGRLYSAITFDGCERCESRHDREDADETDRAAPLRVPDPQTIPADSDSDFESAKSDAYETPDDAGETLVSDRLEDDTSLASDRLSELSLRLEDPTTENKHLEIAPIIENKVNGDVNGLNGFPHRENCLPELAVAETPPSDKEPSPVREEDPALLRAEEALAEAEEEERPQRVRRCSSLKTGKTPPGTPGRKKIVRFVDVLGLDLADVKTFMDEIPVIPKSAYEDLLNADLVIGSPPKRPVQQRPGGVCGLSLVPLFQTARDVTEGLEARCVCLEAARCVEGSHLTVSGSVRVRNLDFHKTVHVRYTMDNWRTYTDLQATYVQGSCDGFSDRFSFLLYVPAITAGQRLEIAVRFQCKGRQYWDNNFGANYCFDCLPLGASVVASLAPLHLTHDWHPSFY